MVGDWSRNFLTSREACKLKSKSKGLHYKLCRRFNIGLRCLLRMWRSRLCWFWLMYEHENGHGYDLKPLCTTKWRAKLDLLKATKSHSGHSKIGLLDWWCFWWCFWWSWRLLRVFTTALQRTHLNFNSDSTSILTWSLGSFGLRKV